MTNQARPLLPLRAALPTEMSLAHQWLWFAHYGPKTSPSVTSSTQIPPPKPAPPTTKSNFPLNGALSLSSDKGPQTSAPSLPPPASDIRSPLLVTGHRRANLMPRAGAVRPPGFVRLWLTTSSRHAVKNVQPAYIQVRVCRPLMGRR